MHTLPKARMASVVVQSVGSETLIYDKDTDRAYCLNETASSVWNSCDGKTTVDEFVSSSGMPREVVGFALDKLRASQLLDDQPPARGQARSISRREAVVTAARFAVALPVVSMIVAPQALNAQSAAPCLGFNQSFELGGTFPTVDACVTALITEAKTRCCSGTLNPQAGFEYGSDPALCRGFCGDIGGETTSR